MTTSTAGERFQRISTWERRSQKSPTPPTMRELLSTTDASRLRKLLIPERRSIGPQNGAIRMSGANRNGSNGFGNSDRQQPQARRNVRRATTWIEGISVSESKLHRVSVLLTPEVLHMLGMISSEKNLNRSQAIEMCLHAGLTSLKIVKRGYKFDQRSNPGQPKKVILKRRKPEISSKPD